MKINIVIPRQSSIYSDFYNVAFDLSNGLHKIGVEHALFLVKNDFRNAEFPFEATNLIKINFGELVEYAKKDEIFIMPDDFNLLLSFYKMQKWPKFLLIWVHYFYGHKFLFKRYRELPFKNFKAKRWYRILDLLPPKFAFNNFYGKALYDKKIVAQSLWSLLLLERVYNIPVLGRLLIPVDKEFYPFSYDKNHKALIYLNDVDDTDIESLKTVIKIIQTTNKDIEFNAFGNESMLKYLKNFNVKFLGKLDRKELGRIYSEHLFTINPVYNGTFEMVPIQSLLCGTPVITFYQPFMEVTGESPMIANIENLYEIKQKIKLWSEEIKNIRESIRNKILEQMDNEIVAKQLVDEYIPALY
ncbi:MAG: glycosyltransferase [Caldisphaera sp.]|nr:glycosyltransferase [Caldisphaera sp.]